MRLDWGKGLPGFSEMFTKSFIPGSTSPEHQKWFNDLQKISATPENAARILEACDEIDVRDLLPVVSVPTMDISRQRFAGGIAQAQDAEARYPRMAPICKNS